ARMFERRLRTYQAIGYVRGEAVANGGEGIRERTVEYDEEAVRYLAEGSEVLREPELDIKKEA
ncbi:MAG: hypothetical protein M3O15_07930, partial [Acidobacteriota bacterium]|nr:hypothetical protein [Acidobacteriota bacterium]